VFVYVAPIEEVAVATEGARVHATLARRGDVRSGARATPRAKVTQLRVSDQ
jgi:hypothetical protein